MTEIPPGCILAADLKAGSTFLHSDKTLGETEEYMIISLRPVTVLRDGEPCKDQFERDMTRYWCRDDFTGREGFCTFGPAGFVRTEPNPPYFVMAQREGN